MKPQTTNTDKSMEVRLGDRIVEILNYHFGEYLKDKPNKRSTVKGLIKALILEVRDNAIQQAIAEEREKLIRWAEKEVGKRCAKTDFIYQHLLSLRNSDTKI